MAAVLRMKMMLAIRLLVMAAILLSIPLPQQAFAISFKCNLYQKWVEEETGVPCQTVTTPYENVSPSSSWGEPDDLFARDIPKCENGTDGTDGTDMGCEGINYVRCADGTRPFYHIDPVADSNNWVFFFQGGGSCGEQSGESAVGNCAGVYGIGATASPGADRKEMTSDHPYDFGATVKDAIEGKGILRADASNVFSSWNRVHVYKCSYDRFMGNGKAVEDYLDDEVVVYFHGRKITEAMFKDLDRSRGSFVIDNVTVPTLSNANKILVAGNSGGAGGLIHNAEWIKRRLDVIAPNATKKFVLDARFMPSVAAEGHFEDPYTDLYDDDTNGTSYVTADSGLATATLDRSMSTYALGGEIRKLLASWGNASMHAPKYLDESCLRHHTTDITPCFSESHVLFNHFTEDVFIHQTLDDGSHAKSLTFWTDNHQPGFVFVQELGSVTFSEERKDRVVYMADQWRENRGLGCEDLSASQLGLYIVDRNQHVSITNNQGFGVNAIGKLGGSWTLHDALNIWVQNSAPVGWCTVADGGRAYPMTAATCGAYVAQ